jgi:hypothetical protein
MVRAIASLPPPAAVGTTRVSGRSLEASNGKAMHPARQKRTKDFLIMVYFSKEQSGRFSAPNHATAMALIDAIHLQKKNPCPAR